MTCSLAPEEWRSAALAELSLMRLDGFKKPRIAFMVWSDSTPPTVVELCMKNLVKQNPDWATTRRARVGGLPR